VRWIGGFEGLLAVALAVAQVERMRFVPTIPVVAGPSVAELVAWSDECLRVPAAAWPAIDQAQDDLADELVRLATTSELKPSMRRTEQRRLERHFVESAAAIAGADDECRERFWSAREERRMQATLSAEGVKPRLVWTDDLLDADPRLPAATLAQIRAANLAAGERFLALIDDAASPLARPRVGGTRPLHPLEREAIRATVAALDRLNETASADAIARWRARLDRTLSGRIGEADELRAAVLRSLRGVPADRRAAIDAEAVRFAARAEADRVAFREALLREDTDETVLGAMPMRSREPSSGDAAALLPGTDGERLASFLAYGLDARGAVRFLLDSIDEAALDRLPLRAPMPGGPAGESIAANLRRWDREGQVWTVGDLPGPSAEEAAALRRLVAAALAAPPADLESRLTAWTNRWTVDAPAKRDAILAAHHARHGVSPPPGRDADEEEQNLLQIAHLRAADALLAEGLAADRDLIDGLIDGATPGEGAAMLRLWRLDRAARILDGSRLTAPTTFNARSSNDWRWCDLSAVIDQAERRGALGLDEARRIRAIAAEEAAAMLPLVDAARVAWLAEGERECRREIARWIGMGRPALGEGVTWDEAAQRRSAEAMAEFERSFPPPATTAAMVADRWRAAFERLSSRWRAELGEPAGTRLTTRLTVHAFPRARAAIAGADLERALADVPPGPERDVIAQRAWLRLERRMDRLAEAFTALARAAPGDESLSRVGELRASLATVSEDHATALARLERDRRLIAFEVP
jgi:hypothetical protein